MSSLLKVDGKIPFLQILLGVIIGALGAIFYIKFYNPDLNFLKVTDSTSNSVMLPRTVDDNPLIQKEEAVLVDVKDLPQVFNPKIIEDESEDEDEELEDL